MKVGSAALRKETPSDAASSPAAGIRPMTRADIPAVSAMFSKVFAKGRPTVGLASYIETVFFGSPHYSEEYGSVVYDSTRDGISSAILAIPMPFSVHGRPVMARLLCAFMSDGGKAALGAARLARSLRASQVDMCFSDNASPVSADHWSTVGGVMLPVQSLEWQRAFQPLAAAVLGAGRRKSALRMIAGPLRLIDRMLLSWKPSLRPQPVAGCTTRQADPAEFLDCARAMSERFAIHPVWTSESFDWLAGIAAMNDTLGALNCRIVSDANGTIGAFLFLGRPGAAATVMNLVCEEGREREVIGQMFACLAQEGYALATGIAQPFMMNAIMRQRRLSFRHRGFFYINSRHDDLLETARRGDIYIGGLASESWSRLVTDF